MVGMFGLSHAAVRFLFIVPALELAFTTAGESDLDNQDELHQDAVPTFDEYIKAHGRTYQPGSVEYQERRVLYETRVREVEAHNREGGRMWTAGVNIMTDRTEAEMKVFNGFRKPMGTEMLSTSSFIDTHGMKSHSRNIGYTMPTDHSWASVDIDGDKKEERVEAIANIRNQGCGNCWAVATNAMMEAHRQLHGGIVASFSDNELTQCSENFFNCGGGGGCQGSTPELAIMHYERRGVVDAGAQANATSAQSKMRGASPQKQSCPKPADIVDKSELPPHEIKDGVRNSGENSPARSFDLIGWEKLPENQAWPIMLALYERGPVAVALATNGWHQYKSGVYGGCDRSAVIGHSVLATGFGQVQYQGQTVKYWNLQNSWGSSFGENGHFRLLRHDRDDEYCGTDKSPKDGTGCDAGPTSAKICGMCGVLYDALVPYFVPRTWLAKNLAELRSRREAATHQRSGRKPTGQVLSVDGGGSVVPTAVSGVPSWLPSWISRSAVLLLFCLLLAITTGCCIFGYVMSNTGKAAKAQAVQW